ncbi:MAG: DNA polymerase III subunit beta [Flavobacteriales bacterium]
MNFIVSSGTLLKKLQNLNRVINPSNTLPILDDFLFKLDKQKLIVTGSDLQTTMVSNIEVKSEDTGSIAMPAKILLDTLKAFPEQPLTFNIDLEKHAVEISSEQGRYKLTGHDPEEFPKLPELESTSTVKIDSDVLGRAIYKTLFATGTDDMKKEMAGVLCELSNEGVNFVGTDAHKLVKYTHKNTTTENGASIILPKKPLEVLSGVLTEVDGEVNMEFNESNAHFTFGGDELVCRLVEGQFPNYNAVIPKENPNKLTIEREALLNSVKRVSIFSNKTTYQVKFKIAGSELTLSAQDVDFSNEANERLTCSYEGEDMEIGFNARFVHEMLNHLDSKEIQIELSDYDKAGILQPAVPEEEGEEVLMLVMPVMT